MNVMFLNYNFISFLKYDILRLGYIQLCAFTIVGSQALALAHTIVWAGKFQDGGRKMKN